MAGDELKAIKDLHQELIFLSTSQLPNIEKLCGDLEAHIEAFRKLLDKPAKSESSRKTLQSGLPPPSIRLACLP
jgi:nuclear pore complex protein Nup205